MKKVLALVLAVLMLSTLAFATTTPNEPVINQSGNTVTINVGTYQPGEKIYVYRGMSPDADGFSKDVNSDNYSITKVKYEEGRSLVEDIYFDDANDQVVIKLEDNTNLTTNKTLDFTFTLKGKGRDVNDVKIHINGSVGYGLLNRAYLIYDTDDVRFSSEYADIGQMAKDYFYQVKTSTKANGNPAYGELELTTRDGDVDVVVRVYDGDKLYLYNDVDADKDILKAYADYDADLSFLNFPGDTTFNSTATVYMYKDEDSFIYEIKNGKLVESNAKWSEDDGAWVLKARTLGSYVFSDTELDVTEDVDDTVENPDTGANDVVGIAAALGVVALVSAAAVSLKK